MTLKKQIKLYAKTNKISIKKATNIVMQQLEQKRPSNIELRDIDSSNVGVWGKYYTAFPVEYNRNTKCEHQASFEAMATPEANVSFERNAIEVITNQKNNVPEGSAWSHYNDHFDMHEFIVNVETSRGESLMRVCGKVIYADDTPIGMCMFGQDADTQYSDEILKTIYIDPDYRNIGIASKVYEILFDADNPMVAGIQLETNRAVATAEYWKKYSCLMALIPNNFSLDVGARNNIVLLHARMANPIDETNVWNSGLEKASDHTHMAGLGWLCNNIQKLRQFAANQKQLEAA